MRAPRGVTRRSGGSRHYALERMYSTDQIVKTRLITAIRSEKMDNSPTIVGSPLQSQTGGVCCYMHERFRDHDPGLHPDRPARYAAAAAAVSASGAAVAEAPAAPLEAMARVHGPAYPQAPRCSMSRCTSTAAGSSPAPGRPASAVRGPGRVRP